jgi:hypothetical protein
VPSVRSQLTSRKGDADELAIHSDRVALTGEIACGGEARRPGSYSPEIATLSPDNPQSSLTLGKTALPSQRRNIRSGWPPRLYRGRIRHFATRKVESLPGPHPIQSLMRTRGVH